MNARYVLILCAVLVLGESLLTGLANARGSSDEQSAITDTWLTAKSKIALFADARVKGRQIDIKTKHGIVMLRGKVDTDAARQAAEEIVKGLDGVKSVKNELQVVAQSEREVVEEKDEAITAHVKERFAKDPHLKNADISIATNAGVVSLTGEVRDITASAQASWVAWQVPGVKSVKNDLMLKHKA
jgi:osmotically-inducible protein OsmY